MLPYDKLLDISRYLGFAKGQIALVLNMPHQTFYACMHHMKWFNADQLRKIDLMYNLSKIVEQTYDSPIYSFLLEKQIDGESLISMLQEQNPDVCKLEKAVLTLVDMTAKQQARSAKALRERLGFKPLTAEQEQDNLDQALEDLML